MLKHMRLETDNLVIRPYTKEDAPHLYDTLNDPNVLKYIPEEPITRAQAESAVNWLISNYDLGLEADYKYSFAIEKKDTGAYVGWCGFGYLDYDKTQTELYFTLKSDHWGQGFATEAARAVVRYAFETAGLEKLVAVVKPDNRGSQRVIEKLGFQRTGIITDVPEAFSFYEGEWHYVLLNPGLKG